MTWAGGDVRSESGGPGGLADPVPGGRPGDVELAEKLSARLAGAGVKGIAFCYVDTAGITRVKGVATAALAAAARWGVGMSPIFDIMLADGSIPPADRLGGPVGDLRLYPDLGQLTALAGQPGWAWAPLDRIEQGGSVHPGCSRTLLRHLQSRLQGEGLEFQAAIEIEFVLARGDTPADEFIPACGGPAYGMTRMVEMAAFTEDLLAALATQGVEVHQLHPEYAPGQFELSVGALDPVRAADRSVLVRQTVRAIAGRHALRVSFAPSVVAGEVGNGGHVHLSAWRDGVNLFAGGSGRYGLTGAGEGMAAGVLEALPALAVLATPSPSSFLRLGPTRWSGAYGCWGYENREAALRLVRGSVGQQADAANIEVKCADLAANPYLLLAGLLFAARDGLTRGLKLPAEVTVDPACLSHEELARNEIRRLPTTMTQALDEFARRPDLQACLGPTLTEAIIAVRRGEAARMADAEPAAVAAAYRWVY
ncbi:glutamine synthetase family protein [Frankia sp. EUN1f]|uniref:glutamine synthetase family protein n=1 Tax=Parafrankia sp. EUN1f TaxID=102897 RepID=UPI000681F59A